MGNEGLSSKSGGESEAACQVNGVARMLLTNLYYIFLFSHLIYFDFNE